ncbi:hypothetical protein PM10SUCC1_32590 [Propionigenium maris DSM 9537]|uniref:Uncharacterized protein n=1 Tax=Propionigenium maris DSM 9537 TaxID=1123000 RepID=A0A9W6GP47_9FUSO|nr:hypothetical protein [Propionigenium maris]GLI57745.1 hypothetical protein PM10SUCC1_32590 [Propionigenium maris DSM 9537]
MLGNRVFQNEMIVGMAKVLKVPIEKESEVYILYKNERDRVHRKEYFRGSPDDTYQKLLQIEEYRRGEAWG